MPKWIAFTGLDHHLYLLDTTDGSRHQLTSQLHVCNYDWSPNGRYLACQEFELTKGTQSYTLSLFETDGTRLEVAREQGARITWNWSPDGRQLAFTSGEQGDQNGKLSVMDLESGKIRQLTSETAYAVWSRETNNLAFVWSYDSQNIFVMDANGRHRRLLFHDDEHEIMITPRHHGPFDFLPNWSPNGQLFASHMCHRRESFDSQGKFLSRQVDFHLQVIDMQGNLIFRKEWEAFRFFWSPDSRRLACIAPKADLDDLAEKGRPFNAQVSVCVLERGGSPMHVLGPTFFLPSTTFAWSPDSQKIAFAGYALDHDGRYALVIADADGENLRSYAEAMQDPEEGSRPHKPFWSPDNKQVAYILGSLRVVGINETTPHAFFGDEREDWVSYDGAPVWQP